MKEVTPLEAAANTRRDVLAAIRRIRNKVEFGTGKSYGSNSTASGALCLVEDFIKGQAERAAAKAGGAERMGKTK